MSRSRRVRRGIVAAAFVLGLSLGAPAVLAQEGAAEGGSAGRGWLDALGQGRTWVKLRYRFEEVDQDGFAEDAHASTLRSVLGYETSAWHGLSGLVEFEDVTALGNDLYDSTTNGETSRPVVADPEDTEVNQVYLQYGGVEGLTARIGRRVIILDDHRFVGDVGWRQNQQTFDALSLEYAGLPRTRLFYAFLDNVNRVFGDRSPQGDLRMASHLLNAAFDAGRFGKLVAYWYYLDFDDLATSSTSSVGLRYAGQLPLSGEWRLTGAAEAAHQTEVGDNPNDVDAGYLRGELGAERESVGLTLGYEVLGGSKSQPGDKFTTPLATLHKFNGWADVFLNTPDAGIEDTYVSLSGKLQKADWAAVWHEFSAESGSSDYGSELDLLFSYACSKRVRVGLKLADYRAEDFATDTQKIWGWVELAP